MDPDHLFPISASGHHGFGARVSRRDTDDRPSHKAPTAPHPPDDHEDDIAMRHMDEPHSTDTASLMITNGDYGLVCNPRDHGDNVSLLSTAKMYDHHESRKFLFKTGFVRLFVTLFFCLLIGLSLKAYEGFSTPRIIGKRKVRVFNALMLGLSLGLGLNLASSLKRYAVILRWSILTKRYVSLEVFDLILGCETLTKVGKLMIISIPGISKVSFLRRLPWFRESRDDGTRFTWIVCFVWLTLNIGAQVLVATLSLFWPVDPSDATPLLTHGTVRISDLATWKIDAPHAGNASALAAANAYGNQALAYPVIRVGDEPDRSNGSRTTIYKGDGYWEYRFLNRNPDRPYTNYFVSDRTVQASASCTQLETSGDLEEVDGRLYANGSFDGRDWDLYAVPQYVHGSISWVAARAAYCGPRCTNLTVYQASDSTNIKHSSLFLCNSTLAEVQAKAGDLKLRNVDNEHVYSTDGFARIAAGAIAWTGYTMTRRTERQTRVYLSGLQWSPYRIVNGTDIEDLIARFSISAIAAFDDHGVTWDLPDQSTCPVQGQQLTVDWSWVLGILAGIFIIQLGALIALLSFANKSIIRDESFFSMAMLLSPVVNRIGREGMNLSGEEIKRHPKLRWRRIRYDYREGKEGEPNQVDIFWQGRDMAEARRSWANGVYS
ncbi:hypothetical protein K469DRAFT_658287 [Zopfia rhizophila CBS 207.26]|uniref:Uncharacterized protein n=1 Tax=Zopfia rhizophila CBS 207.26 TaxID=1314779 RepID=A0A6A6EFX3_9PEZI|nr:hypothetical protein K469DRAFT_658287 [Zopfia rhizophila CBS 207.26]